MNVVERNLVWNALGKIKLEWQSDDCVIKDGTGFYTDMLNDAMDLMKIQLGSDAVKMWDEEQYGYYPQSIDAYLIEIGSISDFIKKCIEGKNPTVVAFDAMAMRILVRLENFLDGLLSTESEPDHDQPNEG